MWKIIIVLVFTIGLTLSTADTSPGQPPPSKDFYDTIRNEIDTATKHWIEDVKKLTNIDVEITKSEQNLFKDIFIKKVTAFVDDKNRVILLGKRTLKPEAIDTIRSQGVFNALKVDEKPFWFDAGLRKAIYLTAETTRNIYYALLLAQIDTTSVNPKIKLLIKKYLPFFDCEHPPYSKWYCH